MKWAYVIIKYHKEKSCSQYPVCVVEDYMKAENIVDYLMTQTTNPDFRFLIDEVPVFKDEHDIEKVKKYWLDDLMVQSAKQRLFSNQR